MSIQLAEQFETNEQYEQAYEEYKKEYEKNPQDVGIIERLGHLSLILERPDDAAAYYYEILKLDVKNALAYEQLMSIYENTDKYKYYIYRGNKNSLEGKLEFAINDFKKALNHANDDNVQIVMTRLTIANIYRQIGNKLKAIDEYNLILEYENLNEDIFLQLADIYLEDSVYSSAVDTLQRAKQKGFDTLRINEALATVYLKAGDAKNALNVTQDELLKIQCMLELGNIDEAYKKLDSLPNELKNTPRYYTLKAQYAYSSKDFDKALEYINEYNKLEPNSPLTYQMKALVYDELEDKYNSHLYWGKYNMLRGNKDIAIHEYLNAVQINDKDINLLFTLAEMLESNKDSIHAIEYYEKILKIDSNNKEALNKLAKFRESIGDYRKQVEYLETLYEVDKRDMATLKALASAYEKVKYIDKAKKAYEMYLERVTDSSEYTVIKNKIEKFSDDTSSEDSDGLIDKIMKIFNR